MPRFYNVGRMKNTNKEILRSVNYGMTGFLDKYWRYFGGLIVNRVMVCLISM